jgi:hypothetical protein
VNCGVCGRPGSAAKVVTWYGAQLADAGTSCSAECTVLLFEASAQASAATSPYETFMSAELARRWRARRAQANGLPFDEPEPKSPAELEFERVCLMRWGRTPEELRAVPAPGR